MHRSIALVIALVFLSAGRGLAEERLGPFVFAYDLYGEGAPEVAAALGLNALYLPVYPQDLSDLTAVRRQMAADRPP